MGCYTSQNTGRLSQLASSLQVSLGDDIADQVMSRVYSKQFEKEFGVFALPEQMNPLELQETLSDYKDTLDALTNSLTDLVDDPEKEVELMQQIDLVSTVIQDLETISQGKYSPIPLDAELEPDFNWVMQNLVHPDLVKLSERAREGKQFTNGQEKAFLDYHTRWKALSDEGFRVPSGMALARYEQMVQLFGADQVTKPKELGEGLSVVSVKKPRFVPSKQMAFEDFSPEPGKFSYKGVQIETPFTLSKDQIKVLEQLIDYVEDFTPGKAITVEGAAGTGKTTIIGLLSTYLGKKGTVAYMAPTHAATAQLALATAKIGNKNLPNTTASGIAPQLL